jgi:hypothetical protein
MMLGLNHLGPVGRFRDGGGGPPDKKLTDGGKVQDRETTIGRSMLTLGLRRA